jgi:hypothetical protein
MRQKRLKQSSKQLEEAEKRIQKEIRKKRIWTMRDK